MASLLRESLGGLPWNGPSNAGINNFTLDANNDALEIVFQAIEGATITHLGLRYGVRTGTPPTFRISLQGVDASGNPDGTVKGGGSPASATFTPPADATWNGTWQWIALANSYVVSRGEYLAYVIDYSSGTIDGSNNSSFSITHGSFRTGGGLPYAQTNNATVRSRASTALLLPVFGYKSASKVYGNPAETISSLTLTSGTTPDEAALRFQLDGGLGDAYTVVGARVFCGPSAASTVKMQLYSGTTVLQDVTMDTDAFSATANQWVEAYFDEASLTALSFGTEYRLSFAPQAAINFSVLYLEMDVAADLDAWPGGTALYWSQRTDLGAWSDNTLRRPFIELILSDWTEPASAGLRVHPGMTGGMRG